MIIRQPRGPTWQVRPMPAHVTPGAFGSTLARSNARLVKTFISAWPSLLTRWNLSRSRAGSEANCKRQHKAGFKTGEESAAAMRIRTYRDKTQLQTFRFGRRWSTDPGRLTWSPQRRPAFSCWASPVPSSLCGSNSIARADHFGTNIGSDRSYCAATLLGLSGDSCTRYRVSAYDGHNQPQDTLAEIACA